MSPITVPTSLEAYRESDFHHQEAIPHTVWVIHSPTDTHFFLSLREAEKFYKKIKQAKVNGDQDAKLFSKPQKYILDNKKIYKRNKLRSVS